MSKYPMGLLMFIVSSSSFIVTLFHRCLQWISEKYELTKTEDASQHLTELEVRSASAGTMLEMSLSFLASFLRFMFPFSLLFPPPAIGSSDRPSLEEIGV